MLDEAKGAGTRPCSKAGGDPWAHPPLSAAEETRARGRTSLQGELQPNRLVHPTGASWMRERAVGAERGESRRAGTGFRQLHAVSLGVGKALPGYVSGGLNLS